MPSSQRACLYYCLLVLLNKLGFPKIKKKTTHPKPDFFHYTYPFSSMLATLVGFVVTCCRVFMDGWPAMNLVIQRRNLAK